MNTEISYQEKMETIIRPWIGTAFQEEFITSSDGTRLHCLYCLHPEAKASVTFVHGFCEFSGKYHEVLYNFYQQGYSVFFLELRGHGKSERKVPEKDHVHVESFDEYLSDIRAFHQQIVEQKTAFKKQFLFAHSMGGACGALYLEKYPGDFQAAVLSSPMLEMNFGNTPDWQVTALSAVSKTAGWEKKLLPGSSGWTGTYDFEHSSCLSEERYAYQFSQRLEDEDYRTWSGTYQWAIAAREATKQLQKYAHEVRVPVLVLQAGMDTMVNNHGQDLFVKNCSSARMFVFPESKHEIFNAREETLTRYYRRIFDFLDHNLL